MKLSHYIQVIQVHLITTHAQIFSWFDLPAEVKNYRPKDNGWTISEILEHIALTSHYLMILIDKGAAKARQNANSATLEQNNAHDFDLSRLDKIGRHKSFDWIRPEHMEPKGLKTDFDVKQEMIEQVNRCLNHLDALKNGEGLLHTTTMTVNDLGRLNVYEYIYFLSKHAERHIAQLNENKREFETLLTFPQMP